MEPRVVLSLESRARGPEIGWALATLLEAGGLEEAREPHPAGSGAVRLHYGRREPPPGPPTLWIRAARFFEEDYGTPDSLPEEPVGRLGGVPVLFRTGEAPLVLRKRPGCFDTEADLVASAFFLLSGYEETVSPQRDAHGRFLARHSVVGRAGLATTPLVDLYARALAAALRELAGLAPRSGATPGGPHALVLTHDVDRVRPAARTGESAPPGAAPAAPGSGRRPTVLDPVLDLEERYGVRSTCFFLAGGEDPVKPRYGLGDRAALRALGAAGARAVEVGLHGSYSCLERPGALESERDALRRVAGPPAGFRQHYLRASPADLRRIEAAGFLYDSSMGWADAPGFRNGIARPYRPFDFGARRPHRLVEIPLVAMDRTFQKYQGLDADAAWTALSALLEIVRRVGGCVAVLWHPEFLDPLRHPGYDALYERMLRWLGATGGRAMTGALAAEERRPDHHPVR